MKESRPKKEEWKSLGTQIMEDKKYPGQGRELSTDDEVKNFVSELIPRKFDAGPGNEEFTKKMTEKFSKALAEQDREVLKELAKKIEMDINYHAQKIRDTKNGRDYISKLEKAVEFLRRE